MCRLFAVASILGFLACTTTDDGGGGGNLGPGDAGPNSASGGGGVVDGAPNGLVDGGTHDNPDAASGESDVIVMGGAARARAVAPAPDGGFVAAGNMGRGESIFALGSAREQRITTTTERTFLARFSKDGALVWVKDVADSWLYEVSLAVSEDGVVALGGSILRTTSFGGEGGRTSTIKEQNFRNGVLAAFSDQGAFLWLDEFLGDNRNSQIGVSAIAAAKGGGFVVVGPWPWAKGFLSFKQNGSVESALLTGKPNTYDIAYDETFVAQLTSGGGVVWKNRLGGSVNGVFHADRATDPPQVAVLNDGRVVVGIGCVVGGDNLPKRFVVGEEMEGEQQGPQPISVEGSGSLFPIALGGFSASGSPEWARVFHAEYEKVNPGDASEFPDPRWNSLRPHPDGGFVVAGDVGLSGRSIKQGGGLRVDFGTPSQPLRANKLATGGLISLSFAGRFGADGSTKWVHGSSPRTNIESGLPGTGLVSPLSHHTLSVLSTGALMVSGRIAADAVFGFDTNDRRVLTPKSTGQFVGLYSADGAVAGAYAHDVHFQTITDPDVTRDHGHAALAGGGAVMILNVAELAKFGDRVFDPPISGNILFRMKP